MGIVGISYQQIQSRYLSGDLSYPRTESYAVPKRTQGQIRGALASFGVRTRFVDDPSPSNNMHPHTAIILPKNKPESPYINEKEHELDESLRLQSLIKASDSIKVDHARIMNIDLYSECDQSPDFIHHKITPSRKGFTPYPTDLSIFHVAINNRIAKPSSRTSITNKVLSREVCHKNGKLNKKGIEWLKVVPEWLINYQLWGHLIDQFQPLADYRELVEKVIQDIPSDEERQAIIEQLRESGQLSACEDKTVSEQAKDKEKDSVDLKQKESNKKRSVDLLQKNSEMLALLTSQSLISEIETSKATPNNKISDDFIKKHHLRPR